jgi:hypothetical protein
MRRIRAGIEAGSLEAVIRDYVFDAADDSSQVSVA